VSARFVLRLAAFAALALALALAACGVKGPLEPPASAAPAQATAAPDDRTQRASRRPPPIERPDKPFILDSLL
jgi:predicted small lipoprotein YifL